MKQTKKIQEKQLNKNKNSKIKKVNATESNEMVKLIQIFAIVAIIFGLSLLLTYYLKNDKSKDLELETEIQYLEILVGEIWNKTGNYYVLLGSQEDTYLSAVDSYLNKYLSGLSEENKIGYHIVNLDSIFNKAFVAEQSNIYAVDHNQVRFSGLTLLYLNDGKVISAYEGLDAIMSYVKGLQ